MKIVQRKLNPNPAGGFSPEELTELRNQGVWIVRKYCRTGGWRETVYPYSIDNQDDPFYMFTLYCKDSRKLGEAVLLKTKYNFWETHIDVRESCKGYGSKLYQEIFKFANRQGLRVRSSTSPTDDAKRLWKSRKLRAKFRIRKYGKRYRLIGKK